MKANITSKEAITQVCRHIAADKSLKALNMRLVADDCKVLPHKSLQLCMVPGPVMIAEHRRYADGKTDKR